VNEALQDGADQSWTKNKQTTTKENNKTKQTVSGIPLTFSTA